jgi:hypothetical protein
MKLNTKQVLVNFKNEELKNGEKSLTIADVLCMVLSGKVSNPVKGWYLGKEIATKDEVTLKAEDIVFLKKELEATEIWNAIVVGQMIEMLDK